MIAKFLIGVAVPALLLPSVAMAQNASPESGSAASDDSAIIVTAQRREQRLQDVPISVTALSGASLTKQGITSTHDIAQSVTGMTITESGGYVQPFIRGVGSTVTNLGEPGSAATYIDGVYMPTVNGQLYELANIESIQVLKGPQGTLFGRNANTGAILITTRQPQQDLVASFNASYGNFNAVSLSGFISGGLAKNVALSVSGNFDRRDSWFINRNPTNSFGVGGRLGDTVRHTLRAALLIQPSDKLKITINGDTMRGHDPSAIVLQPSGGGYQGYLAGSTTTAGLYPTGPYDYIGNENVDNKTAQDGASLKLDFSISDNVSIVSTSAYRHYLSQSFFYDSDTTPTRFSAISNRDTGSNYTQEILVSGNSPMINWVLGGFYLRQDGKQDPLQIDSPAGTTIILPQQITNAYAAFADATVKLGMIELTGGLRYSHEIKEFSGSLNGVLRPAYVNGPAKKTWNSWTPRAVIAFHPSDNAMLYASFSKGFKSGAFNSSTLSAVPIDPELVDAFEAGFKLTVAPGFTVNGAVFHYDTKNLQVQALNPATNLIELRNAAAVKSDGFDLDAVYSPVRDFTLKLGVSYLKAKFSSFPNAQLFIPNPAFTDGRNMSTLLDVTGRRNVRSPDWTVNFAADYRFELPNGGSIVPSANVYYSSKFYWTVDNRLFEPSHVVVNASLTWNLPGDKFSLGVFGRNITDEVRFRSASASGQADRRTADEPALYGIRAGLKF